MSETSKDKTKRKYIDYLTKYEWTHRYSIFYQDKPDSVHLIDHMVAFKHELRRKYKESPFLIRVQLLHKGELQSFAIITTNRSDLDVQGIADKTFPVGVNVIDENLTLEKIGTTAHAIRTQHPHNLDRFFARSGVNRWAVLNKKFFIQKQAPSNFS